jgi:ADP-ribose pyrophosphatase YjhB (NUDIX family)
MRRLSFSARLKRLVPRLVALTPVHWLMGVATRIVVPCHRVGAGVVLFNECGEVLLLRHTFHDPTRAWGLPGGWLNRRETAQQGALRELREETGLSADLGPLVSFGHEEDGSGIDFHFLATNPSGTLRPSFEIIESAWVHPDHLPVAMRTRSRQVIRQAVLLHHHQSRPA